MFESPSCQSAVARHHSHVGASLLLLITAVIWGAAFLAQKLGADHLGAFAFTGARSLLGGLSLIVVITVSERGSMRRALARAMERPALVAGFASGSALFIATAFPTTRTWRRFFATPWALAASPPG